MKRMMRGTAVIALFFFVVGCGGRTAVPVAEYQYGDENKSCEHIKAELSQLTNDIVVKRQAASNTVAANVVLTVAGFFFLIPWFLIDLKYADQVEADALQRRQNAVTRYAADKKCGVEVQQIKAEEPKPVQAPATDSF